MHASRTHAGAWMVGAMLVFGLGAGCNNPAPSPQPQAPTLPEGGVYSPPRSPLVQPSPPAVRPPGLSVLPRPRDMIHSSDGSGAVLTRLAFFVRNDGAVPCTLRVEEIQLQTFAKDPNEEPASEVLLVSGFSVDEEPQPGTTLSLAPGRDVELGVDLAPLTLYEEEGRRAFLTRFSCGDFSAEVSTPLRVSHNDPGEH